MGILVAGADPAAASAVADALEALGWTTSLVAEGCDPDPSATIVAVGLAAARAFSGKAKVLAIVSRSELGDLPPVEDFALAPLANGELETRVKALVVRPTMADTTRARLMAAAVDNATEIVELATPDAVLQYVNPSFVRILGYTSEEAVGTTPAELMRSSMHRPGFFTTLDETLRSGRRWSGVLISKTKAGGLVHLETTISPLFDDDGNLSHHVAVKRDITEQLDRQRALALSNAALEAARDAALAASKAKSEFLANMSHELRTPLNAIIGYSELLLEDDRDEQEVKDLEQIVGAGQTLLELINDVLDIAKIEADKLELSDERVEIAPLVNEVLGSLRPVADDNRNQLRVDLRWPDGWLQGDPKRLRQVLVNLVSNACKFTEDGQITVTIDQASLQRRPAILLQVQDTGVGITAEEQERLFRPFEQGTSTTASKHEGTGLGLAIAERLCKLMGGTIELTSVPGRGSTFSVHLPLQTGQQHPSSRAR